MGLGTSPYAIASRSRPTRSKTNATSAPGTREPESTRMSAWSCHIWLIEDPKVRQPVIDRRSKNFGREGVKTLGGRLRGRIHAFAIVPLIPCRSWRAAPAQASVAGVAAGINSRAYEFGECLSHLEKERLLRATLEFACKAATFEHFCQDVIRHSGLALSVDRPREAGGLRGRRSGEVSLSAA